MQEEDYKLQINFIKIISNVEQEQKSILNFKNKKKLPLILKKRTVDGYTCKAFFDFLHHHRFDYDF